MRKRRFTYLIVLLLFTMGMAATVSVVRAQQSFIDLSPRDSIQATVIPALSYSSDLGFMAGGIFNRYDRQGTVKPFRNHWQSLSLISTKGYLEFLLRYETTRTAGTPLRSVFRLDGQRFFQEQYFGIGNSAAFNEEGWENGFNDFEDRTYAFTYRGRWPLKKGDKRLEALLQMGIEYHETLARNDSTLYAFDQPFGSEAGWFNYLGTGIRYDSRNNEYRPSRGVNLSLRARWAPDLLSNDYPMSDITLDASGYFSFDLYWKWVVATLFVYKQTLGDVPFWNLANVTDGRLLRGYPQNRFIGNAILAHSLELRTWFLKWDFYKIRMGAQIFTDRGRVFMDLEEAGELFQDYKQTVGFGGALSLGSPDFILRMDVGFSKEVYRIYVGIGYAF